MNSETTSPDSGCSKLADRYQIRKLLGSGGSGDAYLAWDTSLRREVVIKRVRADGKDDNTLQRILEEASKMAALKHPNIISVYDVNVSDGTPCIVMEHVIGQNLDERVTTSGPMGLEEFVDLSRQSLDALVAAHDVGLIHRDLKPSNIMLAELPSGSFQTKLLDFGMAKFIEDSSPSPQTVQIDGSVQGSVHYISPEQLSSKPVDGRSDLYSLGCSLYFALTGHPPFEGETIAEVITSHLTHRVIHPRRHRAELPQGICDWLVCLFDLNPDRRFSSALEAMHSLKTTAIADGILSAITTSIPIEKSSRSAAVSPHTDSVQLQSLKETRAEMLPWPKVLSRECWRDIPFIAMVGAVVLGTAVLALVLLGGSSEESRDHGNFGIAQAAAAVTKMPETDPLPITVPAAHAPLAAAPQIAASAALVEVAPAPQVVAQVAPVPAPVVKETPAAPQEVAQPAGPEVVFRITGSNTIGAKLMPALVMGFLKHMGAVEVAQETPGSEEVLVSFSIHNSPRRQAVRIETHGSSTAFQALKDQTCQIGISSRAIKPAEVEQLAFLGDMLAPACEHVVALDGVAVVVNSSNPVSALTISQLADIFSGTITDWVQVGGSPGPIHLYARDDKSGTYDSFKSLVLGDRPLDKVAKRFEDSLALSDGVASDPAGIGFIGLPYVKNSKALAISDEGTQSMLPSPFTVATEDYLLSRRLYFYTPMVPTHPWTPALVEFALSDEGQAIAEETGVISQRVETEKLATSNTMPEKYVQLAKQADGRLSVSFRFRTGQSGLDAKSVRDLDRVIRFLARPENRRKETILLGFSDSVGSATSNLKISGQRAAEVSRQLAQRGVVVADTVPLGAAMPVASNATVPGQQKNRRVELWLR
ncbi:MAG: substrate-binding domain-containing protein [Luteolibacter sp.]